MRRSRAWSGRSWILRRGGCGWCVEMGVSCVGFVLFVFSRTHHSIPNKQIRGTGEVIERIVSREQQRAINRLATEGDGRSFQVRMLTTLQQQQQQQQLPPRR